MVYVVTTGLWLVNEENSHIPCEEQMMLSEHATYSPAPSSCLQLAVCKEWYRGEVGFDPVDA